MTSRLGLIEPGVLTPAQKEAYELVDGHTTRKYADL